MWKICLNEYFFEKQGDFIDCIIKKLGGNYKPSLSIILLRNYLEVFLIKNKPITIY